MTDTASISSDPYSIISVVILFAILFVCGSAGSFLVYRLFVKRFGYNGNYALPFAVVLGVAIAWPSMRSTPVFDYVNSEQMYFTVWGFGLAYLSYFYNGYRSEDGPFVSPTDLWMAVLSMPVVGLLSTGIWLALTGDKIDIQSESRHGISDSLRRFHFARLIAIPIVCWTVF